MSEPTDFSSRRQLLKAGGAAALLLLVTPTALAGAKPGIVAVRVWPAADYTRVTLEHEGELKFSYFALKDPERLVVDIEGVEFNGVLESLAGKIGNDDPYIRLLRAGRNKPGVVRLVMDLKTEVAPQVFSLKPVGEYGNRLVLDIYPATPPDPLMQLLGRRNEAPTTPQEVPAAEPRRNDMAKAEPKTESKADSPVDKRPGKAVVDRLVTITLDPGHGGEDPGAIGRGGSREKDVTLQVARRLKARIDREPNMRAVLTRDADFFVPLAMRVQKARRLQSDLFVSIHADAWVDPAANGSSVFVLSDSGASSAAARWLAKKENDADLIGGVNLGATKDPHLAKTLLDLSQTATNNDSMKLGKSVLGALSDINRLHKGQVEQAGFAVLKAPDIPSILVETAFISNPAEEKRLTDDDYQDKLADAILRGIRQYFSKNPPPPKSGLA